MGMFEKATKEQTSLRAAFYGPSGSGKTYSCLRIATGLVEKGGGKVAVICTERRSARKYSDRFAFDVCDLEDKTIKGYTDAIEAAGVAGYGVLIIDSLSHAWEELKDDVERIAKAHFHGNTWAAWSKGTPKQRAFVETILGFPGHVLVTMRSRTEWVQEENERGKQAPKRVGTSPVQGKGIEYEFDLLVNIDTDHIAVVEKDRSEKFQDSVIEKPGEDLGRALAAWLSEGEVDPEFEKRSLLQILTAGREAALQMGCTAEQVAEACKPISGQKIADMDLESMKAVRIALAELEPEAPASRAQAAATAPLEAEPARFD